MAVKKKTKQSEPQFKELNIEMVPIGQLIQAKNNTKVHTTEQVDFIIKSIKTYGFNDPIAVDDHNEIIEGHGRRLALLKMGAKYAPVIRLSGLTPAEVKAYRIAHNKATLDTPFDMQALGTELGDLVALEFDIDCTGFSMDDIPSFDDIPGEEEATSYFNDKGEVDGAEDAPKPTPKKKEKKEAEDSLPPEDTKSETKPVIQYQIIFSTNEQQKEFHDFLRFLRKRVPGETVADRIVTYLRETMGYGETKFPEEE